jgi:hypothetical protein
VVVVLSCAALAVDVLCDVDVAAASVLWDELALWQLAKSRGRMQVRQMKFCTMIFLVLISRLFQVLFSFGKCLD